VELDANEPPIADGSSREYCKMIESAGIVSQPERREPYTVTEPIELEMAKLKWRFSKRRFQNQLHQRGQTGAVHPFYSVEISPRPGNGNWRTPGLFFFRGDRILIKNGLIKGGQPGKWPWWCGTTPSSPRSRCVTPMNLCGHKILDIWATFH